MVDAFIAALGAGWSEWWASVDAASAFLLMLPFAVAACGLLARRWERPH